MAIHRILQAWKNLSVFKKLYGVVGLMALLIAFELLTMLFAMDVLSSVRAFVGGEGSWSKAQKDSIQSLYNYAFTGDRKHYLDFQQHLKINYGDRQAREQLQSANPDMEKVHQGFVQGNVHPDDVAGVVRTLQRFHQISYVNRAIQAWTDADTQLDQLIIVAEELDRDIAENRGPQKVGETLAKVSALNTKLTALENEFSSALGEGSRWLEGKLKYLLIFAVLVVECTGLYLTFSFSRSLSRSIQQMTNVAKKVGGGDFSQIIPVESEDELGQLSETINQMSKDLKSSIGGRQKAESANKVKSLFLANMSHEIRTPLGLILGLTEALKQPGLSEEQQKKFIQTIDRTSQGLKQIINDILDISKMEAGRLDIEKVEFDLKIFLADLYDSLKLGANKNNNKLSFHDEGTLPDKVFSDRVRLRQILLNILGNALKFTKNGSISLTAWEEHDLLHFRIVDTGAGISADQVSLLFQPFSQGDSSTTRKYGGTGLGLFLSKQLAVKLGGDIKLEKSAPGAGSSFLVTINGKPGVEVAQKASNVSQEQVVRAEFVGKKVLVVDDSPDNQMLLEFFLGQRGIKYDSAMNGAEALAKVNHTDYDLIFMDIQMPVMDGYEATQRLRKNDYKKPIIALTAHAMKEDQELCLQSGCDEYLTKPLDVQMFQKTLLRYLS